MAEEIELRHLRDKNGKKIAPFAPEAAIYDEKGRRLSDKLKELNLNSIREAQDEALSAIDEKENEAIGNFSSQRVTPGMLSESTKQLIEASGGGTITNLADDEDLESKDDGTGSNVIKLKNRPYNPSAFSGKGYTILRMNISPLSRSGSANILTQEMISQPNTVYEVRYDFDLNGAEITVPEGCILKFEGGSLNNGRLHYNGTKLINAKLINVDSDGNIINDYVYYDMASNSINDLLKAEDNGEQVIDLQGKTITSSYTLHINRKSAITIRNGTFRILEHYSIDPSEYLLTLENVNIIFGNGNNNEVAFYGDTTLGADNSNRYPDILLKNCTLINTDKTYIQNAFFGRFNSITAVYCKFIDCGIQATTNGNNITSWNPRSFMSYDHCIFSWDATKIPVIERGNRDAINCNVFDNLFVTNCTFNNITNSCVDCYLGSNIIFSGNKLINCKAGIELKSIYRESNWADGVGQGELPRNHSIIISNNVVDNCDNFISTSIYYEPTQEGDYTYFISKKDKYKRTCLIANNTIYYTKQDDTNTPKYCILGDPIEDTLITGNIFYSENEYYYFIRDRYNPDLSLIQYYNPIVNITNCIFNIPENKYLSKNIVYSNYNIKNCYFKNNTRLSFSGNQYHDNNITIENCNNLTLESIPSHNADVYINCNNCDNFSVFLSKNKYLVAFNNVSCDKKTGYLVQYTDMSGVQPHKNLFIVYKSYGIILQNSSITNIVICDDFSYCRKADSFATDINYKNIKPFDTKEDLEEFNMPLISAFYYKKVESVSKRYTFNYSLNGWYDDNGIKDSVKQIGTFEEKPTKWEVNKGFSYYCTDRKTSEGSRNGIMIYHDGENIWVDALGRIIS
jgi:hypothetical protein